MVGSIGFVRVSYGKSKFYSGAHDSFFRRCRGCTVLVTAGEEYKVVGWNTYTLIDQAAHLPMGSFDYDFSLAGRRQVTDMLDNAVAAGFNTVRTW